MTAHEFHQADAAGHAARLGVRAVEHAARFLDGGEIAEGARDEADVVVDRLGHADDGERVAAAAGFLVEVVRAALRAIAADGEQDVHAAPDEIVHRDADVHRPARRTENRAAFLMNVVDELGGDRDRLHTARRIEPAVTAAETKHLRDAVAVVQFEEERADDVVEAGTQATAGHDAGPGLPRVEEELARGPASSNWSPGSTPTSMCSGMRMSSLIVRLSW